MKAIDLLNDLISSSGRRLDNTVDRIITGDGDKDVKKVLTAWICSLSAVKAALACGCDATITHEPTFYFHRDELENIRALDDGSFMKQTALLKKKLLDDSGIVVIRIHDSWDIRPVNGIADAWAATLGFGEPLVFCSDGFQRRYDIEPTTLDDLAKKVASRTSAYGEPLVQVIGDGRQIVSKVCIGPGYASTVQTGREMDCDVNIICDDGSLFWMDIQCAVDMGYPVIRVNHGTSEEPGSEKIAEYVNGHYVGITAIHFPHVPYCHLVGR